MPKTMEKTAEMQKCIDIMNKCHNSCVESMTYSVEKGCTMNANHVDIDHVRVLNDCADICRTSADMLMRGADYASDMFEPCAGICEASAKSCSQFDDEKLKNCAATCRECSETCQSMLARR